MRKSEIFARKLTTESLPGGYLATTDALTFLGSLKDGVADVMFLDPPFNLGKSYGALSTIEHAEPDVYDVYMRAVLAQSHRVLRDGGALFVYQIPRWAVGWANYLSGFMLFRHWIAIAMKNGFARGQHLYPAHYALLYFTKGEPAYFRRPKLEPRRCRHCNRVLKDYGGYRRIVETGGLNLSDVWDDLSPVRHEGRKHRASNQLPVEITDRVCAIAGDAHLLLVDPFAGTGTCLVSAVHRGMHFVANDIESANSRVIRDRLKDAAVDFRVEAQTIQLDVGLQ